MDVCFGWTAFAKAAARERQYSDALRFVDTGQNLCGERYGLSLWRSGNRLPGNGRSETNREKWSSGLAPGPAHAKENVPCSGLPRRWAIRIRRRMT